MTVAALEMITMARKIQMLNSTSAARPLKPTARVNGLEEAVYKEVVVRLELAGRRSTRIEAIRDYLIRGGRLRLFERGG